MPNLRKVRLPTIGNRRDTCSNLEKEQDLSLRLQQKRPWYRRVSNRAPILPVPKRIEPVRIVSPPTRRHLLADISLVSRQAFAESGERCRLWTVGPVGAAAPARIAVDGERAVSIATLPFPHPTRKGGPPTCSAWAVQSNCAANLDRLECRMQIDAPTHSRLKPRESQKARCLVGIQRLGCCAGRNSLDAGQNRRVSVLPIQWKRLRIHLPAATQPSSETLKENGGRQETRSYQWSPLVRSFPRGLESSVQRREAERERI